jgi:hypothetical protein
MQKVCKLSLNFHENLFKKVDKPIHYQQFPAKKRCHCEEVRRSNLLVFAEFRQAGCFVVPPRNDSSVLWKIVGDGK